MSQNYPHQWVYKCTYLHICYNNHVNIHDYCSCAYFTLVYSFFFLSLTTALVKFSLFLPTFIALDRRRRRRRRRRRGPTTNPATPNDHHHYNPTQTSTTHQKPKLTQNQPKPTSKLAQTYWKTYPKTNSKST